jgi:type I restriction enzyme S subunit
MRHTFPARWKARKLDQLGFVGRGRSRHRPRNEPSLYGGEYPFFQTGDVKAANLYLSEYSQTYNEKGLAQSKQWAPGTLCITIAANIADTAILGIHGCFPDSVIGFVADPSEADIRFVKYYIDLIKLDMQQVSHGTTQDNLSLDKLLRFDFVVPDVEEQRKIAAILSAYDDLIENNLRRIKILEEMAQNLYREWFVKFRFPGHQHARFTDSPLGKIPEGWEVVPFTEIADVLSGGTPKTTVQEYWSGSIPFFAPKDAPESFYVTNTEKAITELGLRKCNSNLYPKDTVFITARGTVGKIVMPAMDMAMNQSCYALRGKQGISQQYLFLAMREQVDYLKKNTGGATFDTIVVDTFRRMLVAKPGNEVITQFSQLIQPGMQLILNIIKKNTTLRRTRDLLLPKLISGEVDVSELDITISEEAT